MRRWAPFVLALLIAGCGSDSPAEPDASPSPPDADGRDLLVRLNDLPGVSAVESVTSIPGERHFELSITQPVDHTVPGGPTFTENVTLVHRGLDRPMVAVTTGYWNFYRYRPFELTELLAANQIVIEHRFFSSSRPVPPDWSMLTIAQAAADQHHIIELLKTIYAAPWVTTGASKGGMTAVYHRRFYPDDVAASVPYVAPISFAIGDTRYPAHLDTIGPAVCRQALRDLEVELLRQPRWDALLVRAQQQAISDGYVYTRIALGPALEGGITGIEWSFWQYVGAGFCDVVPAITATDDTMWTFLDNVSGPSGSTDDALAQFDAYTYQASFELGYPDGGGAFLAGLTRYPADAYAGAWPVGVTLPPYRPVAMADIDGWVQTAGTRLLFIYGEWDPWSGGKFELGAATDSLRVIAPGASHGAGFLDLTDPDKAAAYARIEAWTGVTPDETTLLAKRAARIAPPREPRIPPAVIRAWKLRQQR